MRAKRSRRKLRGNLDSSHGRIFRDITNLVHLDAGFTGERGFQLFGKRGWFGIPAGERTHKARQLRLGQSRREMNAGDAGRNQQRREAALARCRSQRDAIQQNLGARCSQQHAASTAFIERAAQFLPGGLKLRGRAHVAELVQAREFQQDVQAAYECPCRSSCISGHRLRKQAAAAPRVLLRVLTTVWSTPRKRQALCRIIVPISITFSCGNWSFAL